MREPTIEIGTRGTLKKFKQAYTADFLKDYGYRAYGYKFFSSTPVILAETVKTKYGELVIHSNSMITYVGHGVWSVSKD